MNYSGSMDGWHGDENECQGNCGRCDECEYVIETKGDSDYDASREEWSFEE
jgi:hypothetical protein